MLLTQEMILEMINSNRIDPDRYFDRHKREWLPIPEKEQNSKRGRGNSKKWSRAKLIQNIALAIQFQSGLRINEIAKIDRDSLLDISKRGYLRVSLSKNRDLELKNGVVNKKDKYREIPFNSNSRIYKELRAMVNKLLKIDEHFDGSDTLVKNATVEKVKEFTRKRKPKFLMDYLRKNSIDELIANGDAEVKRIGESDTIDKTTLPSMTIGELQDMVIVEKFIARVKVYEHLNNWLTSYNRFLKKGAEKFEDVQQLKSHDLRRDYINVSLV